VRTVEQTAFEALDQVEREDARQGLRPPVAMIVAVWLLVILLSALPWFVGTWAIVRWLLS
jgi:hypothetical protein